MADLAALEEQLRDLSHGSQALGLIQAFAKGVGKTKARQVVFVADGALGRSLDWRSSRSRKPANGLREWFA
ncbi:hypothetical protein [Synechococcus sp. PCC 7336]|uniref:hypothetical protein n=1 Tax=Synechococcus sp. PCC 7336 TaxID=195250 RepID=UPI00034791EA|nr:hypothetical protein [Synechococcus sp. PCC 7336]